MIHLQLGLLRLAGSIRWYLSGAVAVGLAITASYVVQDVLVAHILAGVFRGGGLSGVAGPLAGVVAALCARAVLLWLGEVAAQLTAQRVKERVRGQVIERLLALGPGYLARQRTGEVQTIAVEGVEALEAYFGRYLPSIGICLLGPMAILAYLAVLDWPLAVLIAVFVVLVPLVPRLWDKLTAARAEARWQAYSALDADYVDTTQGMTTLKAFNATERVGAQLATRARHLYETTMGELGVALVDTGLTTFGILAGSAVAIGVGVVRVADGGLALVTLFTVLFVARECFRPFGALSTYWHVGFAPQQGVVRLGGVDVRNLPLATVRAATAVVSQDTYLFHGTIADNIRLGRPEATDAELAVAAQDADIHEFVAGLPEGYATQVGERGMSLSGGQRQRIAIARALLKDAPILVLDEATSNVDAASEAAIQQALSRLSAGRTTLVIAHRLSTVRDADRIVVLTEGRATETGRHDELLAHRGGYARLVAAQEGASS